MRKEGTIETQSEERGQATFRGKQNGIAQGQGFQYGCLRAMDPDHMEEKRRRGGEKQVRTVTASIFFFLRCHN